jgi:hypothetical protein
MPAAGEAPATEQGGCGQEEHGESEAHGSVEETPHSTAPTSEPAASAPIRPDRTPAATNAMRSRRTRCRMSRVDAPMAIRVPISPRYNCSAHRCRGSSMAIPIRPLRCGRGPGFCGTASIAPRPRRTSCTRRKYRVPVFGSAGVIGGRDGGMGVSGCGLPRSNRRAEGRAPAGLRSIGSST